MATTEIGLLLFTAVSFGMDAAMRKIPNALVAAGVLLATALHGCAPDGSGWFIPAVGALAGIACAMPLYASGAIAAGDAKWFAAAGAFAGPAGGAGLVLGSVLAAGTLAACTLAFSGTFRRRCSEFAAGWYIRAGRSKWKAPAGVGTKFPFLLCAGPVAVVYVLWR